MSKKKMSPDQMIQAIYTVVGGLADDMKTVKNEISGLHNKVDDLNERVDSLDKSVGSLESMAEKNERDHEGFQSLLETIADRVGNNHEKRITKLEKLFKN